MLTLILTQSRDIVMLFLIWSNFRSNYIIYNLETQDFVFTRLENRRLFTKKSFLSFQRMQWWSICYTFKDISLVSKNFEICFFHWPAYVEVLKFTIWAFYVQNGICHLRKRKTCGSTIHSSQNLCHVYNKLQWRSSVDMWMT